MSVKNLRESFFDLLKVPTWGRVLVVTLIPIFLAVGAELWKLNHDVGVIQGELSDLPQNLSKSFLNQAKEEAGKGEPKRAIDAVRLAAAAIGVASHRKIEANPGYFRSAVDAIDLVQSQAKSVPAMDSLHRARVELANYRSAIARSVMLPNLPIKKVRSTEELSPAAGKITFIDMGDAIFDGAELPAGTDFYSVPSNNTSLITTSIKWFLNGSQTLDGIQWTDVTFVRTKIKYFGGRLDLHNDRFVDCPFEIVSTAEGDALANAIALNLPSFTSTNQPGIFFHHLP